MSNKHPEKNSTLSDHHDEQQHTARDFADPPTNLHEYGADVIPGKKHVLDIDTPVATVYSKAVPDEQYISSDTFVTFDGTDEIQLTTN